MWRNSCQLQAGCHGVMFGSTGSVLRCGRKGRTVRGFQIDEINIGVGRQNELGHIMNMGFLCYKLEKTVLIFGGGDCSWRLGSQNENGVFLNVFVVIVCFSSVSALSTVCRFWHSQNPFSGVLVLTRNMEKYIYIYLFIIFRVSCVYVFILLRWIWFACCIKCYNLSL